MDNPRQLETQSYTVALICPLAIELSAIQLMLDEFHKNPPLDTRADDNQYTCGSIYGHNVVIVSLPLWQNGVVSASHLVNPLTQTFPNLRATLLIGVGGGIPCENPNEDPKQDIHLGDVVIGWSKSGNPAVIQWDSGKRLRGGKIDRTSIFPPPDRRILNSLTKLQSERILNKAQFQEHLKKCTEEPSVGSKFAYPGVINDTLYEATYRHPGGTPTCALCDPQRVIYRRPRDTTDLEVHFGTIASGSSVMQDPKARDKIRKEEKAICFEMEAAGILGRQNCLVLRGISDYADSHKNDMWKPYAAATAASVAREILRIMDPGEIAGLSKLTSEEQECLDTFSTCDYERYLLQSPQKFPGTLKWFSSHETYCTWLNTTSSQLLLVNGPPGCGKTVISRALIDELCGLQELRIRPTYFFCNNAIPSQRTAHGILTVLIHQILVRHSGSAFKVVLPYYRARNQSQWALETLWELFAALVLDGLCPSLVIDGLDECDDHSQTFIIQHFHQLVFPSALPRLPLKVFLTCRLTFTVKAAMISYPISLVLAMEQQHQNISGDLSLVIQAKIKTFANLYRISPEVQRDIARKIEDKADGNFLWVTLAEDLLRQESIVTVDGIEQLLDRIPSGLTGVYNAWITLAARPLKTAELGLALALESGSRDMKYSARRQFLNVELELLKILGPLVKVLNDEVYLVHKSAKEFLLGSAFDGNGGRLEPHIQIVPSRDHATLAEVSLRYLSHLDKEDSHLNEEDGQVSAQDPKEDNHPIYAAVDWLRNRRRALAPILEEFPFLEYAGSNWTFHAKHQDQALDYSSFDWLFDKSSAIFQQWKALNDLNGGLLFRACLSLRQFELGILHVEKDVIRGDASPIHIAASFGLNDLVICIFKRSRRDWDSALAVASDAGHCDVVEFFLRQATYGCSLKHAILRASTMGHHNVVSILLKHGAIAYDGVLAAGFNGRDKVMQLLLESGAHRQRHLALLAASIGGHSSTVTIILQGMDTLPSYSREIAFSMIQAHNCGIEDPGYLAATLELMELIEEDNPKHDGILAQFWSPLLITGQDVGEWEVALLIATVVGFSSIVDLLLDYWNDGARLEISVNLEKDAC
ncbi:ankyrin repeat containing protein [Metarhizium robertsii ARSEF 23]|uniref:Ankyrin repeat containing protein n=1 Tax=Metarhizium robertsii (strain ARSEF 23 / ATCC MYA-3075) TaxID=655844 RepID=E9FD83_METRA|nr:ankyrin repeat containing protein [Metarhizium robertsii ARSEF 23]EFY94327.2 ankyrin repeat containing protein [Metarhizium robertsii ARSEF 23]